MARLFRSSGCSVSISIDDHDLSDIAAIYEHEIANSIATFDLEPPDSSYWHEKLAGNHPGDHLLVAVDEDEDVVGYAYSWSFRPRPAYSLTRETSIYLDPSVRGKGIGKLLYPALLDTMAESGVHTAVALASIASTIFWRAASVVAFLLREPKIPCQLALSPIGRGTGHRRARHSHQPWPDGD